MISSENEFSICAISIHPVSFSFLIMNETLSISGLEVNSSSSEKSASCSINENLSASFLAYVSLLSVGSSGEKLSIRTKSASAYSSLFWDENIEKNLGPSRLNRFTVLVYIIFIQIWNERSKGNYIF